jgi:hypothetical protein
MFKKERYRYTNMSESKTLFLNSTPLLSKSIRRWTRMFYNGKKAFFQRNNINKLKVFNKKNCCKKGFSFY